MSMHNSGRNDTKNPGGSVGFDRLEAVYTPTNVPDSRESFDPRTPEQTLGDYIARKQLAASFDEVRKECCGNPFRNGGCNNCPPKLTFNEWYNNNKYKFDFDTDVPSYVDLIINDILEECWRAAQENA